MQAFRSTVQPLAGLPDVPSSRIPFRPHLPCPLPVSSPAEGGGQGVVVAIPAHVAGVGTDVDARAVVSSGSGLFVGTCDVAGMRRRIVVNVASTVSVVMVLVFLVSSVSVVAAPGRCRLRSGQFPQSRSRERSYQRSRDLRRSRMNAETAPSNTSAYPTMTAMPRASGASWVSTTRAQTAWAICTVTVVATVAVSSGWDRAKSFDSAAKALTRLSPRGTAGRFLSARRCSPAAAL